MAASVSYFNDFLANIRLSKAQKADLQKGHSTLRDRLENDEELKDIIIATFLQGSYRRSTAVKPNNGTRADVDIIVVTNLNHETYTPQEALDLFKPFLDKHYQGKYRIQGRSIGIELSYVDLDIVPTSAPSEVDQNAISELAASGSYSLEDMISASADQNYLPDQKLILERSLRYFSEASEKPQWKLEPLLIPDREAGEWEKTHPIEQIRWTQEKNQLCNTHYINVVKAIKWWKKEMLPNMKHPKSYPLEHFIGDNCPDGIQSVAEGVTATLESIACNYPVKPYLPDRGVPEHDVFKRITESEYAAFYTKIREAAIRARDAYDEQDALVSARKWHNFFGAEFPEPPEKSSGSATGFTQRNEKAQRVPDGRFAR